MSPKYGEDAVFSNWSANLGPLDQRVRKGLVRFPNQCGTLTPLDPPSVSIRVQEHPSFLDSRESPLGPIQGTQSSQNAMQPQRAPRFVEQCSQLSLRPAIQCHPRLATCHELYHLGIWRWRNGRELPAHLGYRGQVQSFILRIFPLGAGRGKRNNRRREESDVIRLI